MYRKFFLTLAVAFSAASVSLGGERGLQTIYTVPGELNFLKPSAHPQGATCSESAIYVSYSYGIMKLDWNGRLIKTCSMPEHLGDIAYADGRIYGVIGLGFGIKDGAPNLPRLMVCVWNENLDCIGARTYDIPKGRGLDGAVVFGDTLYTCVDDTGTFGNYRDHPPHRDATVMMISTKNLACKSVKKIALDYPIHYCPQTLGTDGKNLLFVSYGARPEEGNDPWLNYTRFTPSLKQIGKSRRFHGQWGFCKVPEAIAGRGAPVFFTVDAVDFREWGSGPGRKPPQLKMRFHSYDDGTGEMKEIRVDSQKPPRSGFWRVERRDGGCWWAVSPDGRKTILRGVDHANWDGHWCEDLGTRPYRDEMAKIFASRSEWVEQTLARLRSWGFNALGAGCSSELRGRDLAHCEFLGVGEAFAAKGGDHALGAAEGVPGTAFPNVFHRDFAVFCNERAAKMCAPQKGDWSLFGYFFDNELAWRGRGNPETGLYEAAKKSPAGNPAREALSAFLAGRGLAANGADVPEAVKTEFVRLVARTYFETISAAIIRHDPNHLLLGCRFAGLYSAPRVVWEEAGKVCDIVTFNQYPWVDLEENVAYLDRYSALTVADAFAERYAWVGKPLMVTEWSFIGLDSGLPCTGGYGQRFRTQAERVRAAELYAKTLFAMPFMVGSDFFMWVDEPALGISRKFPENSNYGLVDGRGRPYEELTAMFARVNREAEKIHATGKSPQAHEIDHAAREAKSLFGSVAAIVPDASASFVRHGNSYVLKTDSGLVLKGSVGGRYALDSVTCDGLECGSFTFMLYHGDWQDIARVESIKWLPKRRALRISGVGKSGTKSFRVTCDIVPITGKAWFACNVVEVENTGAADFPDVSVWLRQYPAWAYGSASIDTVKTVPSLWKGPASAVWIRAADGAWCGAATFSRHVKAFKYWVHPSDGTPHPDAAFSESTALKLSPGEKWLPKGKAWMVAAAGKGGVDGWNAFLINYSSVLQCVKKGKTR